MPNPEHLRIAAPREWERRQIANRERDRHMQFDPPRLTFGHLSGRVYIVTHGKDLGDGNIEASKKYDITDQFDALAKQRAADAS